MIRGRRLAGVTGALLLLLALMSCASSPRRQARTQTMLQGTLQSAAEDFWDAMRWERYDAATVHAADRAAWLTVSDALLENEGSFRITDYTLIAADVVVDETGAEGAKGDVLVRYELTAMPNMALERRSWAQTWKRVQGQWRLEVDGSEAALFLPKGKGSEGD